MSLFYVSAYQGINEYDFRLNSEKSVLYQQKYRNPVFNSIREARIPKPAGLVITTSVQLRAQCKEQRGTPVQGWHWGRLPARGGDRKLRPERWGF